MTLSRVDIATSQAISGRKPSAETALHTLIYRLFPEAGAVLHTYTVNATVLLRVEQGAALLLHGYEMQKTLSSQHTHLDTYLRHSGVRQQLGHYGAGVGN